MIISTVFIFSFSSELFKNNAKIVNIDLTLVCDVGDLAKEEELLSWLIHQKRHSEIADITDEILDKLIESVQYLAVLFCKY